MALYSTSSWSLSGSRWSRNPSVNLLCEGVDLHWMGSKASLAMLLCSYTKQQHDSIGLSRDQLATVEVYMI